MSKTRFPSHKHIDQFNKPMPPSNPCDGLPQYNDNFFGRLQAAFFIRNAPDAQQVPPKCPLVRPKK